MAQPTPSLYALDPALPVLLRPDGAVQVGWSPRRAVLIRPPRGLNPAGLATLLRTMHSPVPISELQRQANGVAAGELSDLVARLVAAGVATRGRRQRPARSASIRVHGRGPLSELLIESLRCSGARVKQSSQPHAAVSAAEADLVVLSDNLVADPRMLRDLHSQRVAHLAVRVRDGTGLVGPLVIPGLFSGLLVSGLNPVLAAETHNSNSRELSVADEKLWPRCGHGSPRVTLLVSIQPAAYQLRTRTWMLAPPLVTQDFPAKCGRPRRRQEPPPA